MEEEAAETQYWLSLVEDLELGNTTERKRLLQESGELLAIFMAIGKTCKGRK